MQVAVALKNKLQQNSAQPLYVCCLYHKPPLIAQRPEDLTRAEVRAIHRNGDLMNKPVRMSHYRHKGAPVGSFPKSDRDWDVSGSVVQTVVDDTDGSLYAVFAVDTSRVVGGLANHYLSTGEMREVSLTHCARTKRGLEMAVTSKGLREGTYVVDCSDYVQDGNENTVRALDPSHFIYWLSLGVPKQGSLALSRVFRRPDMSQQAQQVLIQTLQSLGLGKAESSAPAIVASTPDFGKRLASAIETFLSSCSSTASSSSSSLGPDSVITTSAVPTSVPFMTSGDQSQQDNAEVQRLMQHMSAQLSEMWQGSADMQRQLSDIKRNMNNNSSANADSTQFLRQLLGPSSSPFGMSPPPPPLPSSSSQQQSDASMSTLGSQPYVTHDNNMSNLIADQGRQLAEQQRQIAGLLAQQQQQQQPPSQQSGSNAQLFDSSQMLSSSSSSSSSSAPPPSASSSSSSSGDLSMSNQDQKLQLSHGKKRRHGDGEEANENIGRKKKMRAMDQKNQQPPQAAADGSDEKHRIQEEEDDNPGGMPEVRVDSGPRDTDEKTGAPTAAEEEEEEESEPGNEFAPVGKDSFLKLLSVWGKPIALPFKERKELFEASKHLLNENKRITLENEQLKQKGVRAMTGASAANQRLQAEIAAETNKFQQDVGNFDKIWSLHDAKHGQQRQQQQQRSQQQQQQGFRNNQFQPHQSPRTQPSPYAPSSGLHPSLGVVAPNGMYMPSMFQDALPVVVDASRYSLPPAPPNTQQGRERERLFWEQEQVNKIFEDIEDWRHFQKVAVRTLADGTLIDEPYDPTRQYQ